MAGVKGRSGQKPGSPPGPGRNHTSIRNISHVVRAALAMFSPGDVGDVTMDTSLTYCAHCGAWGWEGGSLVLWGLDHGVADGAVPLTSVPLEPPIMRHSKKCNNR